MPPMWRTVVYAAFLLLRRGVYERPEHHPLQHPVSITVIVQ